MTVFLSWGSNSHYQLLQETDEDRNLPYPIKPNPQYTILSGTSIIGGGAHTTILLGNGELYACGWNKDGQIGCDVMSENITLPRKILGLPFVKMVACGWNHTLACCEDGSLFGWGSNVFGQLAFPEIVTKIAKPQLIQDKNITSDFIVSIACGLRHSACVNSDGVAFTWGCGSKGQLGWYENPINMKNFSSARFFLEPGIKIVVMALGSGHSIALSDKGCVYVCGDNSYGQSGICLDTKIQNIPQIVEPLCEKSHSPIVSIASGWQHCICNNSIGEVYSWGRSDYGQLGRIIDKMSHPKGTGHVGLISEVLKAEEICCGAQHCMIRTIDERVFTWGWNEHGMCGVGDEVNRFTPCEIKFERIPIKIGCGDGTSFVITTLMKS